MKITVIDIVEKDGDVEFVHHDEEREFPESEGRHNDLCIVCGFPSYPKCREWCPNEELLAKQGLT